MKREHNPVINLRYWVLISLVSIFGTNTGDLAVRWYKQFATVLNLSWLELRHLGPLPVLVLFFVLLWRLEKKDKSKIELYFWLAIIIIRTAATNIADALVDDLHLGFLISSTIFTVGLLCLALLWQKNRPKPIALNFVPETTGTYWLMMLMAGVLGTVLGDYLAHSYGLANSALVLSLLMVGLVLAGYRGFLVLTPLYWLGIVLARIAGTAAGDWLAKSAEKGGSGLDLPTATLISGVIFVLVAVYWKSETAKS